MTPKSGASGTPASAPTWFVRLLADKSVRPTQSALRERQGNRVVSFPAESFSMYAHGMSAPWVKMVSHFSGRAWA
jgi:hypothetical protein